MNARLMMGIASALALGACASAPQPNAALETARTQVAAAQADPNVVRYAPLDLETAKKDLALAESADEHHKDAEVSQPAYMAAQTARLAQARASAKAYDAQVAQGQSERDRIQLAARQREVNTAVQQRNAASQQAADMQAQAANLQAELDKMKAKQTDRGIVLTLGDVLFDTGRAELNPGAATKMDQLAQFLTQHPDRRAEIDGFTDSVGSDAYNEELSQRRANAVKAALVTRGVDPTRINTQGYGKAYPVASNTDSGGRQLNRRVEVVIGGTDNAPIVPRG